MSDTDVKAFKDGDCLHEIEPNIPSAALNGGRLSINREPARADLIRLEGDFDE
jgi:hypothetical protein